MSKFLTRCLLAGSVALLAAGTPALAQSGNNDDGSNSNQSDNQTTNRDERSQDQNQDQNQEQDQDRQSQDQNQRSRQDDQNRRDARQNRQDDRQDQGGFLDRMGDVLGGRDDQRQPAIGVTVVERGGVGVRVTRVAPNSPAAQAGIQPGDTIIEVDGRRIETPRELVNVVQNKEIGSTADFAVLRNGREQSIDVRLSTREQALTQAQQRVNQQRQSGQDQGQRFSGQFGERLGQRDQRWQDQGQSRWDQQRQQFGQTGQYRDQRWDQGQQGQWDQGRQGQYSQQGRQGWDQQQYGQGQSGQQYGQSQYSDQYERQAGYRDDQRSWDQNRQAGGYNDQYAGANRQAYYDQGDRRWSQQGGDDREFGDRLITRIDQLEDTVQRLTQVIARMEEEQDRQRQNQGQGQSQGGQQNRQDQGDQQ